MGLRRLTDERVPPGQSSYSTTISPPEIRFHVNQILALGVIPGPKKPQDFDSFLWPFLQELLCLSRGVRSFDALEGAFFTLRAHLIVVFGDIPAVSMNL